MNIVITLSFNRADFSDTEIEQARRLFADLGETRTDTFHMPAAGSGYEIGVVIDFLADFLLSNIAYDLLKAIGSRVVQLIRTPGRPNPHLSTIRFNFEDKTVIIGYDPSGLSDDPSPDAFFISQDVLDDLDGVFRLIVAHLGRLPLSSEDYRWLWTPVRGDVRVGSSDPLVGRYWQVSKTEHLRYGLGRFYDSHEGLMFNVTSR